MQTNKKSRNLIPEVYEIQMKWLRIEIEVTWVQFLARWVLVSGQSGLVIIPTPPMSFSGLFKLYIPLDFQSPLEILVHLVKYILLNWL